jgi:hypothetical protein
MPRIRSLKIGFFKNEDLASLSPWHRLLFEGLWLLADREGRMEDRPLRIKAELFPYDAVNVEPWLQDLNDRGFITRYGADGARYLAVVKFRSHQRPKNDEAVSVIPAPLLEIPRRSDVAPRCSPLGRDRGQGTEDRGQGEGNGADAAPPAADGADPLGTRVTDVAEAWNRLTEPPIPRCRDLTAKRKRHVRARLAERPLSELETAFSQIQASSFCRGENDRGWMATFDWAVGSPDVVVKVLEGKYDDRRPAPRPTPPTAEADWFVECERLHGGACNGSGGHRLRMQLDAAHSRGVLS